MAATVTIRKWTGPAGGPTKTDVTGLFAVANAEDAPNASAGNPANPILIPAAGLNYSYWAVTRLSADVTPSGTINNIRWHTDGGNTLGTGVTCKMNTATGYTQATGTVGVSGTPLTTGAYPTLAGAPTDAFAFTEASPKAVAGSITNPATGDFGDFVVCQVEVSPAALAGHTEYEHNAWRYDET